MKQEFHPYYILDDRIPVPCDDLIAHALWMSTHNVHVERSRIGRCTISTVFLGLGCDVPPKLFETMCLGGDFDQFQKRYYTWEEAEQGHQDMVAMVKLWRNVLTQRAFDRMVKRIFRASFCPSR